MGVTGHTSSLTVISLFCENSTYSGEDLFPPSRMKTQVVSEMTELNLEAILKSLEVALIRKKVAM